MKKLTGALVLSLSLLMTSACRSAGETAGDASTPAIDAQTPTTGEAPKGEQQNLQNDAGSGTTGAGQPTQGLAPGEQTQNTGTATGSGTGTGTGTTTATGTGSETGTVDKASTGGSYAATLSPAEKQAQENCLDKWLKGKKLDRYGHDEGTMYAGGSPIFNEMTGESRERLDYVYERKPDAKKACATAKQAEPQNTKGIPGKKK
jgi:hypothetical protein